MTTLSVIIITKNEELHIKDCILSVAQIANEVIVYDSKSTDQTTQIAKALGAKVEVSSDWKGFGIQKNRALAMATSDWVLALDADERVSEELAMSIQAVLQANGQETCFYLNRESWYCGRLIKHSGWQEDKILRLFKRGFAKFTEDRVHERIVQVHLSADPKSSSHTLSTHPNSHTHTHTHTQNHPSSIPSTGSLLRGTLEHYSFADFDEVLEKVNRYSSLWAEQRFALGETSSPLKAAVHGIAAFCKTLLFKGGFLDGAHGFALAISNAEGAYYKYLKLWHLNQGQGTKNFTQ